MAFVFEKLRKNENIAPFHPDDNDDFFGNMTLSAVTKAGPSFTRIPRPEDPKLTIYRCREFPDMLVGEHSGQFRAIWLRWWAEKDTDIPLWFAPRYALWLATPEGPDKPENFSNIQSLGIFALPEWMEELSSDPEHASQIIRVISELTTKEVAADATPEQVKVWWAVNRENWTEMG